jgi:hypothetical protein
MKRENTTRLFCFVLVGLFALAGCANDPNPAAPVAVSAEAVEIRQTVCILQIRDGWEAQVNIGGPAQVKKFRKYQPALAWVTEQTIGLE